MSEISNESTAAAQGAELDDFDVEGHGLKEIALGLSAATIVAGGAGATALAMDNPAPGTTRGVHELVRGASGDVRDRAQWATGMAERTNERATTYVADTLRGVQQLTDEVTTIVTTTTSPVLTEVDAKVADATLLAQQAAEDPIGTSDRKLDEAMTLYRDTRDQAVITAKDGVATLDKAAAEGVKTAEQTAKDGVKTAEQTANDGVKAAADAAAGATTLATSTLDSVQKTLDPKVQVETGEGGTTIHAGAAGTSVTVTHGG